MGNGYTFAYPPCSFFKKWLINKILIPIAKRSYKETLLEWRNRSIEELEQEYRIGLRGKTSLWHGYLIEKIVRKPDEKCSDPLAKERCPSFTIIIVMEGNPQIFPMERLDNFILQCIEKAYDIMQPGLNNKLKIEIPKDFFEKSED